MFENIQLIAKKNNKITFPDRNWNKTTVIHCICELNLGLGEKIIWDKNHPLKLSRLIDFYNKIMEFLMLSHIPSFDYSFKKNDIIIHIYCQRICREEIKKIKMFIREQKMGHSNQDRILLEREISGLGYYKFYLLIMNILTDKCQTELSNRYGKLFEAYAYSYIHGIQSINSQKYKIGDKVITKRDGKNVKTERQGFIIKCYYHQNQQRYFYNLLVKGKVLPRRYFEEDLEYLE